MDTRRSFTLIELLVVISIIGLLSSIIAAGLMNSRDKAKLAKSINFAGQVYHALGSNVVGWWSFEDNVLDSSGWGNNGTAYGNPQYVTGITGKALAFDDVDDFVQIPASVSLNMPLGCTFEAWVYPVAGQVAVAEIGVALQQRAFYITTGRNLAFGVFDGAWTGSWSSGGNSNTVLANDQWHHVVWATYSSGANTVYRYYINGNLDKEATMLNHVARNPAGGTIEMRIGAYNSAVDRFKGNIDEVKIYNEVLSAEEIQSHYAEGLIKYGIVKK